ncbi:hypothetical protein EYZ11_005927 [Aspergillus tanneri]|uniref:Uncharacterized protein n=1 Tax=Aspergillus tanneri TaxID=1220188 RepID=A0A4V3UPC4_9EURO|nr:hypothetical protein EYZ11_005927 [Aspergillus tanneri]
MTARLRRIFRYPDDSDGGEHTREELDEQEQEMVVRQLKLQNDRRDSEFRIFLTAIPMFAAIVLALLMNLRYTRNGLYIYFQEVPMFTSIVFARNAMATVDLKQLEDLRYGYKGA